MVQNSTKGTDQNFDTQDMANACTNISPVNRNSYSYVGFYGYHVLYHQLNVII